MSEAYSRRQLLALWNPTRGAWETGQPDLLSMRSESYSGTWPTSGMTHAGQAYALPTPARLTGDSESSSSPRLGTPQARDAKDGPPREGVTIQGYLPRQVWTLLPTPSASTPNDAEPPESFQARRANLVNKYGVPLAQAVLLPTPTTDDANNVTRASGDFHSLTRATQLLPTPAANEGEKAANGPRRSKGQKYLTNVVHEQLLPTPTSRDAVASGGTDPQNMTLTDATVRTAMGTRLEAWQEYLRGDRTRPLSHGGNE